MVAPPSLACAVSVLCCSCLLSPFSLQVTWKGKASLQKYLGKTVRLYIYVKDADLYGFRFK